MTENSSTTDLNVATTLPAVEWDHERLKAFALAIKERYTGLVVTEEEIAQTKHEMAEINRLKKQVDDARKETVRRVSEPIKSFEGQVKEVCGIFDEVYRFLGDQVKAFEDAAREQKRQEVLFAIETLTAEAGYPGLQIPVQDSWLNKSQKPKATAEAIKAIIADHIKAERDAALMEQARQDRAALIESKCSELGNAYGVSIPASQFLRLQDLAVPLAEVEQQMHKAFELKADQMARENMVKAPAQPAPIAAPAGHMMSMQEGAPAAVPLRKSMDIRLEFTAANEDAVRMALRHLKTLCTAMSMTGSEHAFVAGGPAPAAQRARNY